MSLFSRGRFSVSTYYFASLQQRLRGPGGFIFNPRLFTSRSSSLALASLHSKEKSHG